MQCSTPMPLKKQHIVELPFLRFFRFHWLVEVAAHVFFRIHKRNDKPYPMYQSFTLVYLTRFTKHMVWWGFIAVLIDPMY